MHCEDLFCDHFPNTNDTFSQCYITLHILTLKQTFLSDFFFHRLIKASFSLLWSDI